jgi:hypothetical protein
MAAAPYSFFLAGAVFLAAATGGSFSLGVAATVVVTVGKS